MHLTAMTHHDELFELTLRWMNDDFHPDDGETLTRIFVYESAISAIVIERVLQLLGRFWNTALHAQRVRYKHELRERIIAQLGVHTPRVDELADSFHDNPKYFFPFLPIDALVITDDSSRLLALGRIKRMTRVAEKVSFRLVEALFKEIQAKARRLAEQRAAQAGVPLGAFVSSEEAMQNDFVQAEEIRGAQLHGQDHPHPARSPDHQRHPRIQDHRPAGAARPPPAHAGRLKRG
jgi:hypothetical protein